MTLNRNSDRNPLCPDCNTPMDWESAGRRDTETMGGYFVEYAKCTQCERSFEIINDSIYPTDPSS